MSVRTDIVLMETTSAAREIIVRRCARPSKSLTLVTSTRLHNPVLFFPVFLARVRRRAFDVPTKLYYYERPRATRQHLKRPRRAEAVGITRGRRVASSARRVHGNAYRSALSHRPFPDARARAVRRGLICTTRVTRARDARPLRASRKTVSFFRPNPPYNIVTYV